MKFFVKICGLFFKQSSDIKIYAMIFHMEIIFWRFNVQLYRRFNYSSTCCYFYIGLNSSMPRLCPFHRLKSKLIGRSWRDMHIYHDVERSAQFFGQRKISFASFRLIDRLFRSDSRECWWPDRVSVALYWTISWQFASFVYFAASASAISRS